MANIPRVVVGGLLVGAGAAVLSGPAPTAKREKPLPPADSVKDLEKWLNDLAFLKDGRGLPVSTWLSVTDDILQMCAEMDREFLGFLTRTVYEAFWTPLGGITGSEVASVVTEAMTNAPFGVFQHPDGSFHLHGEVGEPINLSEFSSFGVFTSEAPEATIAARRIFEVYNLVAGLSDELLVQTAATATILEDLFNETVDKYREFLYSMGYIEAVRQTLANQPDQTVLADTIEVGWLGFTPQEVPLKALVGSVPQPAVLDLVPAHQALRVEMSDWTSTWSFSFTDMPARPERLSQEANGLCGLLSREISAALDDVRYKLEYTGSFGLGIAVLKTFQDEFHTTLRSMEQTLRKAADDLGYGVLAAVVGNTSTLLGLGLVGGGGYLISTAFTQGKAA